MAHATFYRHRERYYDESSDSWHQPLYSENFSSSSESEIDPVDALANESENEPVDASASDSEIHTMAIGKQLQ